MSELEKLTPEQIKNWRNILATQFGFGPYAFVMSDAEIQKIRDNMQAKVSELSENK